ncbi:MAG TPA: peroxiredoxin-like family protein [Flavisolibacter sp.]
MKKILTLLSFFVVLTAAAQEKPEGLFINSKAPDFALKDQYGATVTLKDLRKKGQTVLLFYRGNWCPYCNRELKAFQDSLGQILTKNTQVIAITPEGKEGIDSMVRKTGAVFPILHDEGAKTLQAYAVGYKLDERTVNRYKMTGIDLLKANNQKQAVLPVPAVYIINTEGTITYRYFDDNYKKRVSVKEILANIK